MGPEKREELGLSNASEGREGLWRIAAQHRGAGKTRTFAVGSGPTGYGEVDNQNATMVLYSRPCISSDQLAKEAADKARLEREGKPENFNPKKVEYFILTRVSDSDSLKVGGDITLTAFSEQDKSLNLAVGFRFNGAGAQQFGKITRRNKPTGQFRRQLAILLDEKVMSAPRVGPIVFSLTGLSLSWALSAPLRMAWARLAPRSRSSRRRS